MCGILFAVNNLGIETRVKSSFKKSLSLISHRGPSTSTESIENNFLLGFNRLAIVDSKNGNQPFYNEDESIILLCNGEIYNYKGLKKLLKKKHTFQSKSDCEVILHLYEELDSNFVNLLRGQFAFILIDKKNNKLLMARDRFGIQPLFYAKNTSDTFFVSSEIKAILETDSTISKNLDPISIKETLFLYGPTPPRTAFQNIFQVKPGHFLNYDYKKNQIINEKRYWKIPKQIVPDKKTFEIFNKLLKNAVKRRFQGDDKELAVYLSGGLDSASILAITNKLSKNKPVSFSIQFDNPKYDESKYQRITNKYLNTHGFATNASSDIDKNLFQSIWHIEQPLIRTAPLPMYSLSKMVREYQKKFVLCGEGADETMFGYPVFQKNLSSIEDKVNDYSEIESIFAFNKISGKKLITETLNIIDKEYGTSKNSLREKQLIEIDTKLSRYLLVSQGDRQSMSHSVEQRFPFLDEDLVDFLFSLPIGYLINKQSGKLLLKKAMKKLLPYEIINRKKQGYLAPISELLYNSKIIRKTIDKVILEKWSERFNLYFSKKSVDDLVRKYKKEILSEVESIGLFFILSTLILDNQFFRND